MALSTISNEDILSKFFTSSKFLALLFLITLDISSLLISDSSSLSFSGASSFLELFLELLSFFILALDEFSWD